MPKIGEFIRDLDLCVLEQNYGSALQCQMSGAQASRSKALLVPIVLGSMLVGCATSTPEATVLREVVHVDHAGSVSPDGTYLSFGREGEYEEFFVRDLLTGEDHLLAGRPGETGFYGAPFSPSGDEVAYSWSLQGATEIRVVGLDGTGLRVLYREPGVSANPQDWSANGRDLLVQLHKRLAQTTSLGVLSRATGSLREIHPPALGYDPVGLPGTARFSPDGRWIAFDAPADSSSANRDIFVVSVDGQVEAPVVKHLANDYLLEWSPDGKSILFGSDRTEAWDLWLVPVQEGKAIGAPEMIRQNVGPVLRGAGFTKEGSLHYVRYGWENDVYVATLGSSGQVTQTETVATHVADDSSVQWSPDGRSLVYARGAGNDWELVVRNNGTGVERRHASRVTRFHFFTPSWAPDGRAVVSAGRHDGYRGASLDSQGLYRTDVETGEVTPLVQGLGLCPPECVEWPVWSPTGEVIFVRYASALGVPRRVVARDLRSGAERELYRSVRGEEISQLAVSPDGQQLAIAWGDYNVGERAGVKVMSISGQNVRDLLSLPGLADFWMPLFAMAWAPDSRHLVYAPTQRGNKRVELKRVSIDGGAPEDLGLVMEGVWPYGLSVHPDGRRIAFTAGSPPREEVWALEKFLPPLREVK